MTLSHLQVLYTPALTWLIKLPFVPLAVALMVVLGLAGVIVSLLGMSLITVFGIGLLILPIGLVLLLYLARPQTCILKTSE